MKIILLILLILLFLFLIFYRNDREDFACNITQPCTTIKCTDGQVKASLINNKEMCKCCDLDYINESEEKLKVYYNFDSTTLRSDSRIRNMSINTASDASNNSLITTPSYRYYKFENRGVRGPRATSVSIGAFKLLKDDKVVYNIGGWNDPKFGSLLIDLGNDKPPINQYTFNTFGINPQNDPVSWDFYGSNDNTTWSLLDSQKNINMPIQRNQQLPDFTIGYSLSYDATLSPGLNSNISNGVNGFIGPSCATFINENGFTDFMTIDTIKLDSNKFTFSFWISKSQIYTSQLQNSMYILQFQDILKTTSISIYVKYNIINVQLDLPGGSAVFAINETLSYIDKWFHFVWTFDGKDWYVYINNKPYKELKQPSFLNNTLFSNNIIGGKFDKNINNRFIGKIDEFKFYNSHFSSELVSFLYEIGSNNVTPIPSPTISFNYPNTYINVNSSITSKINLNCEYGFSSSSSISGPIMLTFNPPPLNSILGFSEYIFERQGDVYGFKTIINTGIIVVIPIVPDVIYDENNNVLPVIKPNANSKNIENDQTIVLKIIINGSDITYMCNDSVIYIKTRVSKLPVYVVGALDKIGQLFYNINITNKIPSDSSKKTNNLLYLALNKDPKLIYNLQFDPDEFNISPSSANINANTPISKINISGVNQWLQLSQVILIDLTGKRIYYNSSKDKINCGDDKYNQPGWEQKSNKYRPVDGDDKPRGHPNHYHNHPQSVGNAYWEWVFGDPIKISQIIIHSRTDCCTDRLGSFNLNFYDNNNKLICYTKLNGSLTNTFKYENSKLISLVSGSYSLIKNSLTNSTYNIKSFGPIHPVIEDGVNVLRLNDIKNNSDNSQDQHLELDPFDFTPDGTTICFWFKGTRSKQWSRIFDFGTDMCKNNLLMAINSTPGHLHFGTWCQGNDSNYLKYFQNYNNNWIHIAWVFSKSSNQYLLYLNGSLTYRLPGIYPVFTDRFKFYIGKSNWNWDANLNGYLADFKIYQRELISSEVFALYSLHPLKKITDDYNILEPTQLINYKYNLIKDISNSLVKLDKKQLLYLDFDPKNITNNILKNMVKNENNIKTTAFGQYNLTNYNGLNYIEVNAKNYSDSVIVPSINLSYNGVSFSFWIKPDAYTMYTRVFDFGIGENSYNILCYINSSSTLTFGTWGEPNIDTVTVSGFDFTYWTHVVWTISMDGVWTIYNNGKIATSKRSLYPTVITRTSNFIGQSNWSNDSLINYIGLMDEFRMYYKELSITEVSTLYSLKNLDTLNKDNSLVIYYDFETLNGDTLVNRGQNELIFDIYNQNKGNVYKMIYNLPSKINTILKSNDYNYDSMFIKNNEVSLANNSVHLDSTKEISLSLSPLQTNQDGITVAFWFKSDNSNDNSKIFDFGNGPADDNIFFGIKNNLIYCSVLVAGVTSIYTSFYSVNVNDNKWRHVVWILQSNTWYFYINGQLINTRNNTVYPNSILRKNIYFGKSNTLTDPYFNGTLGDFRLYNRILSANELISLYSLQIVDSLNTDSKLALSIGLLTKFTTLNNNSALILNSNQNQYVAIDPIQITNNGISVAFWVIQKNSNDSSKIFDFDSIIGCEFNNRSLYFYINQDNAVNTLDPEITLPMDNTWSHITWTINNLGIHKFYFNGILVKIIDSFYPISNTFTSNFIGKNSLSDSNNFSGILQEFYFTNNELTDVIVSSLHSKPTNVYSDDSILLYYNFDSTKVIKNNDKQPIPLLGYIPEYVDPTPQIKSNTTNKVLDINSLTFKNNDYINVRFNQTDLNGINGYTFTFWFKSDKSANWARIFDFGRGQGIDNILFCIYNNSLACSIYKDSSPGNYTDFYTIDNKVVNVNDNVWRHVTWIITPILTPINYQYYKFTPTAVKNQNTANSVQFSELIISYNGVRVDYSNANATNPGRSPGNETPRQGIDNSINSKFLDFTKGPLIINFGKKTTINEYTFSTANDATERDPISWIFYGSDDGNNWITLDTQNNYPTTNNRNTQLPFFSLNPSNNSQLIKAKFDFYVNSELIKTIDNAPYPNSIDRPYSYLGRSNWNSDPYLNGSIDDFRMYNRVLSTSEINSLFNLTYTDPLKNSNDKLIVSFPMYNQNNIIPYNFLKFDPTIKNYLTISTFNLVQNSLSISFWFKTNSIITPLFEISDDDQTINVRIDNQKLMIQHYIANKSNTYVPVNENNVNDNTWKHFVWIIDPNDNWIFYLNGTKIKSNINYQSIPSTFKKNQIGLINSLINPSNKSNYYYTGYISEFRILNRPLTDNEVNSLYTNGDISSLNDGQQIVYLPFDKNNIIVKSTPNILLDGTLSNERAIVKENAKFGNSCVYLNKPIKDKQYLSIDPFKIDGESFTIAFWYKFEPKNSQNTSIIDFASDLNYFKIYITNNFTFNIDVKIDTDINKNSYSLESYKNDWFHFLLIIKKSTMVAYVNNSPVVYFQKTKYPIINNDTNNYIGRSNMPKNIVSNISNINLGTNGIVPGNSSWNYYSVTWYGYFKPKDTGNYVFSTDSDDASYLWINEFNCTINNALVNNGRPHGMRRVSSRNIYLEANKYYYIRIIFGEQGGGDNMIVRFKGPDNGIDKYERSDGIGYYFNTETITTGLPDSDDSKYKPGLQFDIFNGYFNDDISFFPGITVPPTYNVLSIDNIGVGTNNLIQPNSNRHNYSIKWSGYFYAQETGVYRFSTDSDDASYLWLGDMVTNNTFTAANAIVNNGNDHGMVRRNGQTPSLTRGTYYPILIVFGENGGGHNMIVTFTPPNKNETKNGSGYYFNDATQNIPGLKFRYYNQYFRENLNIFKNDSGDGKATWTNVTPMSFLTNISTDTLNGNIADFRIFNSELPSTDINLLYLTTKNKLVKGIADVESKTIDGLNNDSALLINFAFSPINPFQNSVDNNIKLKASNLNITSSDSYIGNYINLYNNNIQISPFRITNNSISVSFWYKSIFCSGTNNIFNFNINGYGRYGYYIQNKL